MCDENRTVCKETLIIGLLKELSVDIGLFFIVRLFKEAT